MDQVRAKAMGTFAAVGLAIATAVPAMAALGGSSPAADAEPLQVWAVGDHARCPGGQPARTQTRDVIASVDVPILMLGDQVSPSGSAAEYRDCFDPVWGGLTSRMRAVPGNHDYNTRGAAGYFDYFSPIPEYYAWDHGGWRMLALNSMCGYVGGCEAGAPQWQFVKQQLESHAGECQIAYWHHPRWSQASHGNIDKMAPIYELLDDYDVELLLVGHENGVYQRYPALDADGQRDADGVTEFVVSTGGVEQGDGVVVPNPPSPLVREDETYGALLLTLGASSWQAEFRAEDGATFTDNASGACFEAGAPPPTTTTTRPGDAAPPDASVDVPAAGSTASSPVSFSGPASDDVGVGRVRIAVRDRKSRDWLQPDGSFGPTLRFFRASLANPARRATTWSWRSMPIPAGAYVVTVKATDRAGKHDPTQPFVWFSVG